MSEKSKYSDSIFIDGDFNNSYESRVKKSRGKMRIYKYTLPLLRGIHILEMHEINYVSHVQVVENIPQLWAVVNESKPVKYKVHVLYTGDKTLDESKVERIGTAVWPDDKYVLHYYREKVKVDADPNNV